ncbi:MAG: hypothetical protein NVSMB20_03250 [Bradyrhizobium sp.]
MAWTYAQVKAADAALTPAVPDPAAAAAALNAQTVSTTVDVRTTDVRAVLFPTLEYAKIGMTAQVRAYDTTTTQSLVQVCFTADRFFESNKTVLANDTAGWNGAVSLLGQLVTAGLVSTASRDAIVALRTAAAPKWAPALTNNDVIFARSLT